MIIHELRRITKQMSGFSETYQRVDKNRTQHCLFAYFIGTEINLFFGTNRTAKTGKIAQKFYSKLISPR